MSHQNINEPVEILLVEDNPGDARLVQEAFKTVDLEISIYTVSDGKEALHFLREQADSSSYPDLLLLDLNLPRMDGFAILEEIKTNLDLPSLPVLVLTSSKDKEDVTRSYELSANAYLTKPTDPEEFSALGQAVKEFWFETAQLPPVPA